MTIPHELLEKAAAIQLLAMDVDGVLTAGEIIYSESAGELKIFNVKDGHGVSMITHYGLAVAFITGRSSPINVQRAQELGIPYVYQGVKNKLEVTGALLQELNLSWEQLLYIGDDTPDLPVLERAGLAVCPSDAMPVVQAVCDYVTRLPGGRGAVREVTDWLMRAKGWPLLPQGTMDVVEVP